jgi:hypothetical protein
VIASVACEPPLELLVEELLPDELLLVDDPPAPEEELLLDELELAPDDEEVPDDEPLLEDEPLDEEEPPPLLPDVLLPDVLLPDVLLPPLAVEVPPPPQAASATDRADRTDNRYRRRIVLPLIASKRTAVKMSLSEDGAFRDACHTWITHRSGRRSVIGLLRSHGWATV